MGKRIVASTHTSCRGTGEMKQIANGLVVWNEEEIIKREALVQRLVVAVKNTLYDINPAIQVFRIEAPCLIPQDWAIGHLPVYKIDTRYALRGESTKGTYWVQDQFQYKLPICLYQVNKSFRDEKSEAIRISHHRYREFWQIEFQLFYSPDTKADYHKLFVEKFKDKGFGVPVELAIKDLPPYSLKTTDLEINNVEVASLSNRTDYKVPVFEMSFGLDRLISLI